MEDGRSHYRNSRSEGAMKRNDARDFCILYLEPSDDRDAVLRAIAGQHKPVVLMLAEGSRLFQRPEEFVALKHLKSQMNVAIYFVVAPGERPAQLESISATPLALPLMQSSNDPAGLPPVS